MKIYVSHSSSFDYRSELYEPLKERLGMSHELILPHENNESGIDAKALIRGADMVLAEVSYPSTGQGIELAWAEAAGVPVVCVYKHGATPSSALGFIGLEPVGYESSDEMLYLIQSRLV